MLNREEKCLAVNPHTGLSLSFSLAGLRDLPCFAAAQLLGGRSASDAEMTMEHSKVEVGEVSKLTWAKADGKRRGECIAVTTSQQRCQSFTASPSCALADAHSNR